MSNSVVEEMNFARGDPLANVLISRLHQTPARFAILVPVIALVALIAALLRNNILSTTLNNFNLSEQWLDWAWLPLFCPVLGGYYIWITNFK